MYNVEHGFDGYVDNYRMSVFFGRRRVEKFAYLYERADNNNYETLNMRIKIKARF